MHVVGSGAVPLTRQRPTLGLISADDTTPIGADPAVSLCASQQVPVIWVSSTEGWERPLQLFSIRTVGVLVQPVHETQLLAATASALAFLARGDLATSGSSRDESSSHPISRAQLETIVGGLDAKPLTRRQSDIVLMLLDGERVCTIAERFGVECSSVRAHLHRIYEKLAVHSQTQLVRLVRTGTRSDQHA